MNKQLYLTYFRYLKTALREETQGQSWLPHHNAPANLAVSAQQFVAFSPAPSKQFSDFIDTLPPDLSPSDIHLFQILKIILNAWFVQENERKKKHYST